MFLHVFCLFFLYFSFNHLCDNIELYAAYMWITHMNVQKVIIFSQSAQLNIFCILQYYESIAESIKDKDVDLL